MMNATRYLVLDLEATCDEGERNLPREETRSSRSAPSS
jgi:hypothetical protein